MIIIKQRLLSLSATRAVAHFNKSIRKMPDMSAKRSAIKVQNKVLGNKAKKLKKFEKTVELEANRFAIDPGDSVSRIGSGYANRPVAILGAATPIPGGVETGLAADMALKKASPRYAKMASRSGEYYDKNIKNSVRTTTNALRDYIRLYQV